MADINPAISHFSVGDIIEGTITKVTTYGAFMIFDHDVCGLLHISEITNSFIYNIFNMLKVGVTKKVKILSIDEQNGFLKVSMKQISKEEYESQKQEGKFQLKVDEDEISFDLLGAKINEWKEK